MINLPHILKFVQHIRSNLRSIKFAYRVQEHPTAIQSFKQNFHQHSTMPSKSYDCYKYVYLHGFASGKGSSKGQLLNQFFNEQVYVELELPDLNIPSFEKLSVTEIVQHLKEEMHSNTQQYRVIGSSLGGLVAATLASELKDSSKIQSLILLCPALDASNRWKAKLTESELEQWQLQGTKKYYNFTTKSERDLHYGFYEDLLKQVQYPLLNVPITIVHGINDDVVPINISRTYIDLLQQNGSNNELIEVNDDHLLMKAESIDIIKSVVKKQWFNKH